MPFDPIPLPPGTVVVATLDQRQSRGGDDLVDRWAAQLNERHAASLLLPFERTTGDEMQAVATEVAWLIDLLLDATRSEAWWLGVAVGAYDEPLGDSARASRGEAFYRARSAVEEAKSRPWGFRLDGDEAIARAERCLTAVSWIVRKRTDPQQEAVELLRELGRANRVAERLGISNPAVSMRLRGAGMAEEMAGRELAWDLLREAGAR